jgi:hypothetical protein
VVLVPLNFRTVSSHRTAIHNLHGSEIWMGKKRAKLRDYIQNFWLNDEMEKVCWIVHTPVESHL